MNDLYVWCMMFWGHLPDSRYTGTLLNCLRQACVHCECLWLATRPPLLPIWKREERKRRILGGRRDGIGGWAGTDVAVDWAFWEKHSACVSLVAVWGWGREEAPACLPVLCGNQTWVREGGGPASLKALGLTRASDKERERERGADMSPSGLCNLGTKTPPTPLPSLGHCMTGAFFGVFGAATKCAMCYVAWFIIFLQATKLICSPIV